MPSEKAKPLHLPGQKSFTRAVPSAVPSVLHNSRPEIPSLAMKYVSPPKNAKSPGSEPAQVPAQETLDVFCVTNCRNSRVPLTVPSVV